MHQLPAPYDHLVRQTQAPTALLPDERYGKAAHRWSDQEVAAVVQAWASGRPLLVRGESGCGKSQLARALATVLGLPLITEVIHPRYEATDLLYREDPVKRLAQAQLLATIRPVLPAGQDPLAWLDTQLSAGRFLDKGPIWHAMTQAAPVGQGRSHAAWPRAVVLIDEIDKADSDIPNALLDVLGNRSFTPPATGVAVNCGDAHRPFIVITTNEDRELPPAFVRRCSVLNLRPDDGSEAAFIAWLLLRARAHPDLLPLDGPADSAMQGAAAQVWADRSAAAKLGLPTVGLAEYLDLLYSLLRLSAGDGQRALALLGPLSAYALVKQREQDQARPPGSGQRQGD